MINDNNVFHQVGLFVAHFKPDFDNIVNALQNAGYYVCTTLNGDVAIMEKGEYDPRDLLELYECDHCDDEDDDGEDGDDGKHITPYNRNY